MSTKKHPKTVPDFYLVQLLEKELSAQIVEYAILNETTSNDILGKLIRVLGMNRAEELSALRSIIDSVISPPPEINSSDTTTT